MKPFKSPMEKHLQSFIDSRKTCPVGERQGLEETIQRTMDIIKVERRQWKSRNEFWKARPESVGFAPIEISDTLNAL